MKTFKIQSKNLVLFFLIIIIINPEKEKKVINYKTHLASTYTLISFFFSYIYYQNYH